MELTLPGLEPGHETGDESGAVYVFTRSGTTWTERAYLKAPNAQPYDEFGSAVAVSGDGTTLAVAAIPFGCLVEIEVMAEL